MLRKLQGSFKGDDFVLFPLFTFLSVDLICGPINLLFYVVLIVVSVFLFSLFT